MYNQRDAHPLLTDESIQAYVDEFGAESLAELLRTGEIKGVRARNVEHWFARHAAEHDRLAVAARETREERMTRAAERSANRAGWAIAVSLAALAISAWPHIPW